MNDIDVSRERLSASVPDELVEQFADLVGEKLQSEGPAHLLRCLDQLSAIAWMIQSLYDRNRHEYDHENLVRVITRSANIWMHDDILRLLEAPNPRIASWIRAYEYLGKVAGLRLDRFTTAIVQASTCHQGALLLDEYAGPYTTESWEVAHVALQRAAHACTLIVGKFAGVIYAYPLQRDAVLFNEAMSLSEVEREQASAQLTKWKAIRDLGIDGAH